MADFHSTVGIRLFVDGQAIPPGSFGNYMTVTSNSLDGYDPGFETQSLFWAVGAYVGIFTADGYSFSSASCNPSGGSDFMFDARTSFGSARNASISANWFAYYYDEPLAGPAQCEFTINLVTGEAPGPKPDPQTKFYTVRTFADENAGWANPSSADFAEGTTCTISAVPKKGYKFSKWTCLTDGTTVTAATYSFPVNSSTTWLAEFEVDEQIRYMVTTSHDGSGTTSPASAQYAHGETCTVSANPSTGWIFASWVSSTGETSTNPVHSFTVTRDQDWHAVFVQQTDPDPGPPGRPYWIRTSANGNGSTQPEYREVYYGAPVTLEAIPGVGSRFVRWIGPNGETHDNASFVRTVYNNETWTAYFVDDRTEPDDQLHFVNTVVAQGRGILSGSGLYRVGATYTITALTPYTAPDNTKWKFTGWRDDSSRFYSNSALTAVMGSRDITYNAYYDAANKCIVKIAGVPTVTRIYYCNENTTVTGTGEYAENEECTVRATPDSGARLILFYMKDKDGVVTTFDGGSGTFTVKGDTDIYALSLYDTAKFFYRVFKYRGTSSHEADVDDVELSEGFGKNGGPGVSHRFDDRFSTTATLAVSDKQYGIPDRWIQPYRGATQSIVATFSFKTGNAVDVELRTDCLPLRNYYELFTDPNPPYFRAGRYDYEVLYVAGTYNVRAAYRHYLNYTSKGLTFNGAASTTGQMNATYYCGDNASFNLTIAAQWPYSQRGWKFYAHEISKDGEIIEQDVGHDEQMVNVDLDTADVEKDKTVNVVIHIWHEHDGKVLCAQSGDVVCTGDSIVSR